MQNIYRLGFHSGKRNVDFPKTIDGTKLSTAIENPIWAKAVQRD
jgi:hypothetical protein